MIKGNILVYSHTDLDGFGVNLICNYIQNNYNDVKFTIKNLNYNEINNVILEDINNKTILSYNEVFITDISVNEEVAELLNNLYIKTNLFSNLYLFDHHKTAIWLNKYKWCKVSEVDTINNKKTSGTELFYDYLIFKYLNKEQKLRGLIENIKLYDTWLWKEENNIIPKKLNDLFLLLGFEEFEKGLIKTNYNVEEFIKNNQLLLDIQQRQIDKYIKDKNKQLINIDIQGRKVGVVFADKYISELGNKLAELHNEIDIIAMINNDVISYRSIGNKFENDCSEFAKLYLGGGHMNSSGSHIDKNITYNYIKNLFEK